MNINTVASPWVKLYSANSTNASFGTVKSTTTKPTVSSTSGVFECLAGAAPGALVQNAVLLRFFGAGSNNNTGKVRVWGWSQERTTGSWENVLLAEFAITLGNLAGAASCAIASTDLEADTITLTYGNDDVDVSINSNAADVRGAYARVDTQGSQLVQVETDLNSSSTSLNCLYRLL